MTDGNTFIALDSLSANEFKLEINGEEVLGIFRISGFKPYDFLRAGGINTVLITKMVQRDANNPFNKWLREAVATMNQDVNPTRTLSIVAVDDGMEVRRWTLHGAYIVSLSYSDFDTGSTELVEEQVMVQYASVDLKWSATPDLE
jgi:hypothetical protein